jgi:dihydroorotate dehydrogenase (fumarate)
MISLKTKYSVNPLINASGCMCATKQMLDELYTGVSGAIITKSATLQPRAGNPEPRYWESPDSQYTINSMGLPNCGLKYYLDYYRNQGTISNCKTRFVSISGMTLDENKALVDMIFDDHEQYYKYIDAIEINLSCPNIIGHQQLAYDFSELAIYLGILIPYIREYYNQMSPLQPVKLGLKLPPYFEFAQFDAITNILTPFADSIHFIHSINSVPNGLVIDVETESPVIKPKSGFGGLGGTIIKPIALANVRAFYTRFHEKGLNIDIIGSGGVSTGTDVFEFILAGAEMVSVGSQLMMEGIVCFEHILEELEEIMSAKGYSELNDFRGKLKAL